MLRLVGMENSQELTFVVRLQDVDIAQGSNVLLRNVSFELHPNEFVYLVGRVGSGKSSFIATLTGQLPLRVGDGVVCGYRLSTLRTSEIPYLRRNIGVVFQDFKLLADRTVERNLQFVLRATGWHNRQDIRRRIEEVLTLVELQHKAYKMPNQLSGGEQQRVAIARALLNDPPLILADEPTGNLDPATSDGIMRTLRALLERGKSIIMATHNYGLVRRFPAPVLRFASGSVEPIAPDDLQEKLALDY